MVCPHVHNRHGLLTLGKLVSIPPLTKIVSILLRLLYATIAEIPQVLITEILYWTSVEVDLGLLAACLPTLRFFFKDVFSGTTLSSLRAYFPLRSTASHSRLPENPTNRAQYDGGSYTSHSRIVQVDKSGQIGADSFAMQSMGRRESSPDVAL